MLSQQVSAIISSFLFYYTKNITIAWNANIVVIFPLLKTEQSHFSGLESSAFTGEGETIQISIFMNLFNRLCC